MTDFPIHINSTAYYHQWGMKIRPGLGGKKPSVNKHKIGGECARSGVRVWEPSVYVSEEKGLKNNNKGNLRL